MFIMGGEETEVTPDTLEAGAVIPGYILTPLTGSRGDISATGTWADGKWTVVLMRALDTGNEWDVALTPGTPQNFGMSVHHEGRGSQHKAVPVALTLEWAE
jgi:hypothetical protein